jgi:hypothetical protein
MLARFRYRRISIRPHRIHQHIHIPTKTGRRLAAALDPKESSQPNPTTETTTRSRLLPFLVAYTAGSPDRDRSMAAANSAASRVLVRAFKQRGLGVKADAVAALLSVLSREEDVDGALEAILDAIKGGCVRASVRALVKLACV